MNIDIMGTTYEVVDIISNIAIVDCLVVSKHKTGKAHGESKIYISGNVEEREKFFDDFSLDLKGFVWKDNLLEFLKKARGEYKNPQQDYREKEKMPNDFEQIWKGIYNKADILEFDFKKSNVKHSGIYINQNSGNKSNLNWNLIREIALPKISHLSILKLSNERKIRYYFQLNFGSLNEKDDLKQIDKIIEEINSSTLDATQKETLILARVGQGNYRNKLLNEVSICPFTLIYDESLLIASHIKPWKDASNDERGDPKNGFVFTPTYDKLFDRGYISFTDDKKLMISPRLSKYIRDKLDLEEGMLIEKLPIIDNKRKLYLRYHRTHVLKKMEDL